MQTPVLTFGGAIPRNNTTKQSSTPVRDYLIEGVKPNQEPKAPRAPFISMVLLALALTYRHRPRFVLWLNQRNQERQAPNQKGVDTLIRLISVLVRSPESKRSMTGVRVPEYMRLSRHFQNT